MNYKIFLVMVCAVVCAIRLDPNTLPFFTVEIALFCIMIMLNKKESLKKK